MNIVSEVPEDKANSSSITDQPPKSKLKRRTYLVIALLILAFATHWAFKEFNFNPGFSVGQKIDSLNGVFVYYNGSVNQVAGRNTAKDGYNLGLKYQCVEFVKRYYYQHLNHKMPDNFGHAKDFLTTRCPMGKQTQKGI